eukprot:278521_1
MDWNTKTVIFVQQKFSYWLIHHLALLLNQWITDEGIFLSIPLISWLSEPKKGFMFIFCMASQEIINGVLKWIFLSPRPFWESRKIQNLSGKYSNEFSFPSSHAQTAATFSTLCYLFFSSNKKNFLYKNKFF